jgi:putative membrane protein
MGGNPAFSGYYHSGWGWGAWVLGILLTAAFWGLLITAIVWVVRAFRHGGRAGGGAVYQGPAAPYRPAGGPPPPEAILAERFARGEIDEDEYRARMAALHGQPVGGQPVGGPTGSAGPSMA